MKKRSKNLENKADKTLRVYQREKIGFELKIAQPNWTEKQLRYIDIIKDKNTKIVLNTGPAGSSKTFCPVAVGLDLLNTGRVKEFIYVRSVVESSGTGLGYLPGEISSKMAPYAEPFLDKARQLLPREQIDELIKDKRIQFIPVNFLRGREYNAAFVLIDEAQNFSESELATILTRYGTASKMVICGDYLQSDLENYRKVPSGFRPVFDLFNTEEYVAHGIRCFEFGIEDIKRDPVIGIIVEAFKKHKSSLAKPK